ncbi:MAG TPA: hypothetical protein VGE36_14290 [Roseateles sp.]
MKFTIAMNAGRRAVVEAGAGVVDFNGQEMLPHEAAMLADALNQAADQAETNGATLAASLQSERELVGA